MPYIDSLVARGIISPDALDGLLQNVANVPRDAGQPPQLGPEMGRGGGRAGASGEKVVAPDYGAQARPGPSDPSDPGYWREGGEGLESIKSLRAQGKSAKEIADTVGISKSFAEKILMRAGLTKTPYDTLPTRIGQMDKVRRLDAQGTDIKDIAPAVGMSSTSVKNALRKGGESTHIERRFENLGPRMQEGNTIPESAVSGWETLPDGTMVRSTSR